LPIVSYCTFLPPCLIFFSFTQFLPPLCGPAWSPLFLFPPPSYVLSRLFPRRGSHGPSYFFFWNPYSLILRRPSISANSTPFTIMCPSVLFVPMCLPASPPCAFLSLFLCVGCSPSLVSRFNVGLFLVLLGNGCGACPPLVRLSVTFAPVLPFSYHGPRRSVVPSSTALLLSRPHAPHTSFTGTCFLLSIIKPDKRCLLKVARQGTCR